jgi:hypothetical protein
MLPLRELQATFVAHVYGDADDTTRDALERCIVTNGVTAADRLSVYRNNLRVGFRNALALTYPVIERLVGAPYFTRLAREYQNVSPSSDGDLHFAGASFADYLQARFADSEYAYFADVARLEWAIEDGRRAALAVSLELADLPRIAAELSAVDRLTLHPGARLVSSAYPIRQIWQANQPGAEEGAAVSLDAGAQDVLTRAWVDSTSLTLLTRSEAALAAALAAQDSFERALDSALACEPQLDVAQVLRQLVSLGAVAVVRATG